MLMVALMAVAVMTIQGSIALSTSLDNITASVKHVSGLEGQILTEAGIQEARARMKGLGGTNFLGDPGIFGVTNPLWSAYLLAVPSWSLSRDPEYGSGYTTAYTNYIPTAASLVTTTIQLNSLQSSLPYWVKMRHKREYDAESEGHTTATRHYIDNDGSTSTHTATAAGAGNIIYYGYYNGSATPVEFTATALSVPPLPSYVGPVELVKGYGTSGTTTKISQAYLVRDLGPQVPAALYSKGNVNFIQATNTIDGRDNCNAAAAVPPIYTKNPATTTGTAVYNGIPNAPQNGTTDVDISGAITKLKAGSPASALITLTKSNYDDTDAPYIPLVAPFGSPTDYVTFYYSHPSNRLNLKKVKGYGLLLVDGDVRLDDDTEWYGLIYVSREIEFKANGNKNVDVRGAVFANTTSIQGGTKNLDIRYDVCHIAKAMAKQPMKLRRWKILS